MIPSLEGQRAWVRERARIAAREVPAHPPITAPGGYLYQVTRGPLGFSLADPYDAGMVARCFGHVPVRLLPMVRETYAALCTSRSRVEANEWAQATRALLDSGQVRAVESEERLRAIAQARAQVMAGIVEFARGPVEAVRAALVRALESCGVPAPAAKTLQGFIARVTAPEWWRRQLRAHVARHVEAWARDIGAVHRREGVYVSDDAFSRWQQRQRRGRAYLESTDAVCVDTGEVLPLATVSEGTVADPRIRRAELMTRIRGMEEVATEAGHEGVFVTWTCPSRMHARHVDGSANESYDGTTPREAQRHLTAAWARWRAWAGRQGVQFHGLRVAEPHHDGTPHWHLMLFLRPEDVERATKRMRELALEVDGDEAGAARYRFKAVRIDASKGTASGYVAKYIAKNLDGHKVGNDEDAGLPAEWTAGRVRAWASTWGIRQFQQVGGPPVTVWRECRRLREEPESPALRRVWEAADSGQWRAYIYAQGGPCCARRDRPVRAHSVDPQRLNQWREPAAPRVRGVEVFGAVTITRPHEWQLRRRGHGAGLGFPWTRGNNCTQGGDGGRVRTGNAGEGGAGVVGYGGGGHRSHPVFVQTAVAARPCAARDAGRGRVSEGG